MMSVMPKKKGPKGPTQISMRLKPAELGPLDEDRKALPGVPVSRNTYAKHAVLSFPKLRAENEKLRAIADRVRNASVDEDGGTPRGSAIMEFSLDLLREAGL